MIAHLWADILRRRYPVGFEGFWAKENQQIMLPSPGGQAGMWLVSRQVQTEVVGRNGAVSRSQVSSGN